MKWKIINVVFVDMQKEIDDTIMNAIKEKDVSNNYIEYLYQLDKELMVTNSQLDKINTLKKFKELDEFIFKSALNYVYDFNKIYGVTSKTCIKRSDLVETNYDSLTTLLDKLNDRIYTGYKAISMVNGFVQNLDDIYKDIFWKVLDRNLKNGASVTLINKVMPRCIPVFECALANKFKDRENKIDLDLQTFYIGQKIDGCRNLTFTTSGNSFSREGKQFTTLSKIAGELKKLNIPSGYVLDGEICIVDENGNEDFKSIMKEITRKDWTIQTPKYKIFDILTEEEFNNKYSEVKYTERMNRLDFDSNILEKVGFVKASKQLFEEWKQKALENNWEGLMLRTDIYEGKRGNNLLKYKEFQDAEYVVEGVEQSTKLMLVDGLMKEVDCVGNLIITHKNNKVSVGSGLSDEQRVQWLKNPELIIGKTITVTYFEETLNDKGELSLRFPTLKFIYSAGREV